jgi:RHS repeat-associated protein
MGDTSGGSGAAPSLPKGGGALRGIGEKFAPDLHTGTGNFTVPLALPPGRNGFQPQLALVYSSGHGNGPFGLGWSLSIPGVSRKTSDGVPRYDDARDTFLLSGAEDLVPVSRNGGTTRYRPRTEGLFARIERHRDATDDHWEVRTKDGHVSRYGTPQSAGADPAAVADPADRHKVFCWKLSLTTDPFGNRIEYEYERDAETDGPHRFDQIYLKRIRYVDYADNGETRFLVSVTFVYEDAERPDPFSEYRGGFEIRTRRRCARIETRTHAGADRLVRTCNLTYLDQRTDLPARRTHNGVSLLSRVTVVGHDGELIEQLPPLEFDYARFAPEKRRFSAVQGADLPARSLLDRELDLVDLDGNGLPDLIEMNGSVLTWRNLGGGRFDRPREMTAAPAGLSLSAPGVQLLDADGDGRSDLMVVKPELAGYFPLQFSGQWDRRSFRRYRKAPSFDLDDPEVRLLDLDGDGVTDALRSGARLECFFNDAEDGWTATRPVERQALEAFPNVNFSDPRVKLADMSGDGLQDIVLVHDGSVEYWPNLGHGNWGARVAMRRSPRFPEGFDQRRVLIGDIDGDGLADLIYVDDASVTLWINQSGNGWSPPIEIHGTPRVSDLTAVRLVDLNGTGVGGLLWSSDADGLSHATMYFLDFTGGAKPYLLDAMDNHMGAVTRVRYAPSTTYYLQDERRRETRWKTPLPFPVQVVARVEVIDEISGGKLTTEYGYHHGYWDGVEREFRGFGRVDQRDTEVFDKFNGGRLHGERGFERVHQKMFSPPVETRTWFHQGPVDNGSGDWKEADYTAEFWPGDSQVLERPPSMDDMLKGLPRRARRDALRTLRGTILRTELYALDGSDREERPYTVTESLHGVREEVIPDVGGDERPRIFFPLNLALRTTQWERGDDPMTKCEFTDDYDAYGHPALQTMIAVPRGRDYRRVAAQAQPCIATCSETTYSNRDDAQRYLAGKAARSTVWEVVDAGNTDVFALHESVVAGTAARRIIGQTLNFYDGAAFLGLPFGQLGDYGTPVRTERLVLTDDVLREAYAGDGKAPGSIAFPPYLSPDGGPHWTAEYPEEFRASLPPLAGYVFQPGHDGSPYARGYFSATERRAYDYQEQPGGNARGLPKVARDPLGNDATTTYDAFALFPATVTDSAGLVTRFDHDYGAWQPREVADPNGNRTRATFTPLGLVASTAVMGKAGEAVGDIPDSPGVRVTYDLLAFTQRRQPVSARTVRRMHHATEADVPLPRRGDTIEMVEYSDGSGRLLQTRTQAADIVFGDVGLPASQSAAMRDAVGAQPALGAAPRVVVSGWQTYDNKGRVTEKYEPFFSTGFDYAPPVDAEFGQKATVFYDPRGQAIRSVNPDGSEQRVVFGIPADLANPLVYAPTPWEMFKYDANDNAGRTHRAASTEFEKHWNTPASAEMDALGRTAATVVRNGRDPSEAFVTRSSCDVRGNLLTVTDPLGRVAFRYVYDLLDQALRTETLDGGARHAVLNAARQSVEARDSKGALSLRAYDEAQRPTRSWVRDGADERVTLREWLAYGDAADSGLTRDQAAGANLLGQPIRHLDEAGLTTVEACDHQGNVIEKTRRVVADEAILSAFVPPPADWQVRAWRVDWQPPAGTSLREHAETVLDKAVYRTSAIYDGLGRLKAVRYPDDVEGRRKLLQPRYDRAGALEQLSLDGVTFVERIAYNARGQRVLVAFGNGIMTRYAYDPETFRLTRLRTESFTRADTLTWRSAGEPLQDLAYGYDLAGNITSIADRAPGNGIRDTVLGADALDRAFTYDPLYRLLSATGRETDRAPDEPPWSDAPRSTDVTRARAYVQRYEYDQAGNMTRLRHQAASAGFTRMFEIVPGGNRLARTTIGQTAFAYACDPAGSLSGETVSRHFEWDHADRMRAFRIQAGAAEPSVHAHYLYDSAGQRVKKLIRRQGGQIETTVYVDDLFEHHRSVRGTAVSENNTLHVMDDRRRIALVRIGAAFPGDATPPVQYHLGDHLGSSHLVVDASGTWISREDYTPYGETSFGSFARKRYRFAGKERDEESGLYYHGARFYAPWLARWVNCDPAGAVDGLNVYAYARGNPIRYSDPSGLQAFDEISQQITNWRDLVSAATPEFRTATDNLTAALGDANSSGWKVWRAQKAWDRALKELDQASAAVDDIEHQISRFAASGGAASEVRQLRTWLGELRAAQPSLSSFAADVKNITALKAARAGGGGGGRGGSATGGGSVFGKIARWAGRIFTGVSVAQNVHEKNYVRAGLDAASLFVWPLGLAVLYYDLVMVPAANAREPPSAAARCITAHHSEAFEEKHAPVETHSQVDTLSKALEIDELETKNKQGTLTKSEKSRWRRLTSHFITQPLDAGPPRDFPRDD